MYEYNTNNNNFCTIETYQELYEGDILQLSKSDITGFTYPITFIVNEVDNHHIKIFTPEIKYGKATK